MIESVYSERLITHHLLHTYHSKRSEEHTSELQSQPNLVCRLLLEINNRSKPLPESWGGNQQHAEAAAVPAVAGHDAPAVATAPVPPVAEPGPTAQNAPAARSMTRS